MKKKTIMIVEDEADIRELIRLYLEKHGFRVIWTDHGGTAAALAAERKPDLVILDVVLPGKSGFDVCRELRGFTAAPILFLSCKEEEADKVQGLEVGGDDYMTKPFSPNELVARVKAHLRRPMLYASPGPTKSIEAIQIDRLSRVVRISGVEVPLSRKEFDLLSFLASNPDQTFSHQELFREVWGQEGLNDTRTIIVHISNLRKKIEPDPSRPQFIINVHGVGYRFGKSS